MTPWIDALILALPGRVHTDAATLAGHAADKWFASHEPEAVVLATSTATASVNMMLTGHQPPINVFISACGTTDSAPKTTSRKNTRL